jgi:hypothetical protein
VISPALTPGRTKMKPPRKQKCAVDFSNKSKKSERTETKLRNAFERKSPPSKQVSKNKKHEKMNMRKKGNNS